MIYGVRVKPVRCIDRWGQSKITTGSAVADVLGDFTLTPEFAGRGAQSRVKGLQVFRHSGDGF